MLGKDSLKEIAVFTQKTEILTQGNTIIFGIVTQFIRQKKKSEKSVNTHFRGTVRQNSRQLEARSAFYYRSIAFMRTIFLFL